MSTPKTPPFDEATTTKLEAAAFRRLMAHLQARSDVQNIDMMNLAGFCRNCLANWMMDAAKERGLPLDKEQSRLHVYGMPYAEWQAAHQKDATPEQKAAFAKAQHNH
jgi:uncharacterized protein